MRYQLINYPTRRRVVSNVRKAERIYFSQRAGVKADGAADRPLRERNAPVFKEDTGTARAKDRRSRVLLIPGRTRGG